MDWEIYDGQKQLGPMPEASVFDAIRDGLPRNAYVRQRGAPDWVPLETHPLFAVALQNRRAPGSWAPPPPPPPPLIGAVAPVVVEPRPPPNTAYAVASPHAGKPARRQLVGRGCLVQALGGLLLVVAGVCLHGDIPLLLAGVAVIAGLGFVLLLVGGLLDVKRVCSLCKRPVARDELVCTSCRASFT